MTATITRQQALTAGGRLWTSPTNPKIARVYFAVTDIATDLGLEIEHYKSGNIRSARLNGEDLSNARAARLLCTKIWCDRAGIHVEGGMDIVTPETVEAAILARTQTPEN